MKFIFRDTEQKDTAFIGAGTVIVFSSVYLIVQTSINKVQLMNMNSATLVGKVVIVDKPQELTRKEFDRLIESIPGNTTMSDWTFHRLKTDDYPY